MILEHKSIICAGYSAVMHIHCAAEEVTVKVSIGFFFHNPLMKSYHLILAAIMRFGTES